MDKAAGLMCYFDVEKQNKNKIKKETYGFYLFIRVFILFFQRENITIYLSLQLHLSFIL